MVRMLDTSKPYFDVMNPTRHEPFMTLSRSEADFFASLDFVVIEYNWCPEVLRFVADD